MAACKALREKYLADGQLFQDRRSYCFDGVAGPKVFLVPYSPRARERDESRFRVYEEAPGRGLFHFQLNCGIFGCRPSLMLELKGTGRRPCSAARAQLPGDRSRWGYGDAPYLEIAAPSVRPSGRAARGVNTVDVPRKRCFMLLWGS